MKIIDQSYEIITPIVLLKLIPLQIEIAGRTCYKSENKITENSHELFCKKLIKNGHEAMIEHGNITVRFITDRGVSHEIVRHRLASFAQESTRYCNYGNKDMEFIRPVFDWARKDLPDKSEKEELIFNTWYTAMVQDQLKYNKMIESGCSPQEARSVLPNSLKTEIVVTANIREWRHILKLRTAKDAHPQIRKLMTPLLYELYSLLPELFENIINWEIHDCGK